MKVTDVYDKHLAAIKEAERKVRIAKRRLLEAERELDETLVLVEQELELEEAKDNRLFNEGYTANYALQATDAAGKWTTVLRNYQLKNPSNDIRTDQEKKENPGGQSLDIADWNEFKENPRFLEFIAVIKRRGRQLRLVDGDTNEEYPITLEPLSCPELENNEYEENKINKKKK